MKKIISLLLVLIMTVSCMFTAASCDKDDNPQQPAETVTETAKEKTPYELFQLGQAKLQEYSSMLSLADPEEDLSANKHSLMLEDFVLTGVETDENGDPALTVVPDINLSATKLADESFVLDGSLNFEESDFSAKLEVRNGSDFYLSFPDISDKFIYFSLANIFSSDEEGAEFSSTVAFFEEMFPAIEEWVKKYTVESYMTAEKVNVTVFDTEITDADRVTLTLSKEAFEELISKLDALGEVHFDSEESTEAETESPDAETDEPEAEDEADIESVSAAVSFVLKDEELVSYDVSVTVNDEREFSLLGEIKTVRSDSGIAIDAKTDVSYKDGEETILAVPCTAHYEETDGAVSGSAEVKLDLAKFIEYMDSTPPAEGDDAPVGLPDLELEEMSLIDFAVEYTGTLTDTEVELDMEAEIGMTDVVVKVPLTYTSVREEGKLTSTVALDSKIMGFGIKGNIVVVSEAVDAAAGEYDIWESGISYNEITDDDGDNDRVNEFREDFENYLLNSAELTEFLGYFPSLAPGSDADMPLFELYNHQQSWVFWSDGIVRIGEYNYDIDVASADAVATMHYVTGDIVITPKGDGTADINGSTFIEEVTDNGDGTVYRHYYSEEYSTEIGVLFSAFGGSHGSMYEYYLYTMDDATITVTYGDGTLWGSFPYYLDEASGIFTLNGVAFEYYVRGEV